MSRWSIASCSAALAASAWLSALAGVATAPCKIKAALGWGRSSSACQTINAGLGQCCKRYFTTRLVALCTWEPSISIAAIHQVEEASPKTAGAATSMPMYLASSMYGTVHMISTTHLNFLMFEFFDEWFRMETLTKKASGDACPYWRLLTRRNHRRRA
jgi:hypothetical protein